MQGDARKVANVIYVTLLNHKNKWKRTMANFDR